MQGGDTGGYRTVGLAAGGRVAGGLRQVAFAPRTRVYVIYAHNVRRTERAGHM